ncbi:hypothetical protein AFEL58S_01883 [Afipia felis]
MTFLIHDRRPVPEIGPEIERLRRLVADLERIHHGNYPGRRTLATAPILENWRMTQRPEFCLTGDVRGHPDIGDGRRAITSPLWALAPSLGYVRTLSRFYVLGKPDVDIRTHH